MDASDCFVGVLLFGGLFWFDDSLFDLHVWFLGCAACVVVLLDFVGFVSLGGWFCGFTGFGFWVLIDCLLTIGLMMLGWVV